MKLNRELNKINKAESALHNAVSTMVEKIQSVCDFNIVIQLHPGDGFLVHNEDESMNMDEGGLTTGMGLKDVIEIIHKKGSFNYSDFVPIG